jgi:hypothetical protein
MRRSFALFLLPLLLAVATSSESAPMVPVSTLLAPPPAHARLLQSLGLTRAHVSTPPAQSCCKICTVGKACGNTCISRSKTCHVGQGCACDG